PARPGRSPASVIRPQAGQALLRDPGGGRPSTLRRLGQRPDQRPLLLPAVSRESPARAFWVLRDTHPAVFPASGQGSCVGGRPRSNPAVRYLRPAIVCPASRISLAFSRLVASV